MNTTRKSLKLVIAGATALAAGIVLAPASAQTILAVPTAGTSDLTDAQLVAMYEEERLAGDVYDRLAEATGALIFTNISAAEERHQAAVANLLQGRNISVDELPSAPGDYTTAGYAQMYSEFVSDGQKSLADAYHVGVSIETADIADLERLLTQTSAANEVRVLTALLNGSQNHLSAFSEEPATAPTGQALMQQHRNRMPSGAPGTGGQTQAQNRLPNQARKRAGVPGGTALRNGSGQQGPASGTCDGTGPNGGSQRRGYGR